MVGNTFQANISGNPLADFLQRLSSEVLEDHVSAEAQVSGSFDGNPITVTVTVTDRDMKLFDWLRAHYRSIKA